MTEKDIGDPQDGSCAYHPGRPWRPVTERTGGDVEREAVDNENMPRRLGPYSQVVRAGDLLFVSGQAGIDPATGSVPDGGFEAEARMAFANLRLVLAAAGSGLARVAKTTVFLSSADDFPAMNRLYEEFFPTSPPVRSTPIVGLPRNLRISIEAIAVR
jgi:2-iminobutanoate/2-iminopropanoate deaminase